MISTQQECGEREEKPDYTRLSTLWEEKDGLPGGDAGEEKEDGEEVWRSQ